MCSEILTPGVWKSVWEGWSQLMVNSWFLCNRPYLPRNPHYANFGFDLKKIIIILVKNFTSWEVLFFKSSAQTTAFDCKGPIRSVWPGLLGLQKCLAVGRDECLSYSDIRWLSCLTAIWEEQFSHCYSVNSGKILLGVKGSRWKGDSNTQTRPTLISVRLIFGAPFQFSRLQMVEQQKVELL